MSEFTFSQLTWVDLGILLVMLVSLVVSGWRGLIREACSLVTWILAAVLCIRFSTALSDLFVGFVGSPTLRLVCAGALIFILVLLIGALCGYLISQLIHKTGLTTMDRVLGLFFGFARGVLVVAVLILLASLTAIPQEAWWSKSLLIELFTPVVHALQLFLPEKIAAMSNLMVPHLDQFQLS